MMKIPNETFLWITRYTRDFGGGEGINEVNSSTVMMLPMTMMRMMTIRMMITIPDDDNFENNYGDQLKYSPLFERPLKMFYNCTVHPLCGIENLRLVSGNQN